MGGIILQSYVGPGDLYAMNAPGDYFELAGRSMLVSTTGRVFVGNNASQRITLWGGTIASSFGLYTIEYTGSATNGSISVDGSVRNEHQVGSALALSGSGMRVYIGIESEDGSVVATGDGSVAIKLNGSSTTTTSRIVNEGLISGNTAIKRLGAEKVEIVNRGYIDIISGDAYVDEFGGDDKITNQGTIRGSILFGGGNDLYDGVLGQTLGGTYGGAGADTLKGGADDDLLAGDADNDLLIGGGGNDVLDGGAGADLMRGGAGNDTYRYDNSDGDIIDESVAGSNGIDTVEARYSIDLGNSNRVRGLIENITLVGDLGIAARGNALDNVIVGTADSNSLYGMGGDDTLNSAGGGDAMLGGAGNDFYHVNANDIIYELADEVSTRSTRTRASC